MHLRKHTITTAEKHRGHHGAGGGEGEWKGVEVYVDMRAEGTHLREQIEADGHTQEEKHMGEEGGSTARDCVWGRGEGVYVGEGERGAPAERGRTLPRWPMPPDTHTPI
jgi:hypothetical protein